MHRTWREPASLNSLPAPRFYQPTLMSDEMLETSTFLNVIVVPSLKVNELPVAAAIALFVAATP